MTRLRVFGALAALALLCFVLQQTPFAFLPHGADSFILGVALGAIIVSLIALRASRRR